MKTIEPLEPLPPLATADPRAWASFAPHYAALSAGRLTQVGVATWLRHWSDVRKAVWEGWTGVKAAQEHDLTDVAAQEALQRFSDEVMTPSEGADQALAAKLLAVRDWQPGPDQMQLQRRLRTAAANASDATVALEAELTPLVRRYEAIGPTLTFTVDGEVVSRPELDRRLRAPGPPFWKRRWRRRRQRSPWRTPSSTGSTPRPTWPVLPKRTRPGPG